MSDNLHNLYYYANVCHVCKTFGKELPLKRCSSCRMISYCGKVHQKQHWPQHKDLCKVLSDMLDQTNSTCIFGKCQNPCTKLWAKKKSNLMLLVQLKLGRRLEHYEEEMFKFPRVCSTCHDGQSAALKDCKFCPSANFCPLHKTDQIRHTSQCKALRLCFDLDIAGTLFERKSPRHVVPFHKEMAYLPRSIKDFILLYVNENKSLPMSSECQLLYNSEYLTRPLTVLYAIERLKFKIESAINIHVIGANMVEVDGLDIWEILLHWLPSLTTLTIVLIGPELMWGSVKPNVCNYCISKGMWVHIELRNMLYQDYVTSQWYEKPDFLIGYNMGIHECLELGSVKDTWTPCIKTLAEQNCPLVLTSYTLSEAIEEHKKLRIILGDTVTDLCCEINPFSSLRPHRDFETEGVFYQNQFITIYHDLCPASIFNDLKLTQ
ncbi:uncharacterized protein LOC107220561 [Neodiprion lecontei]|uniref:Uncharacterized protein LOC107220561 n=1 Tax=Neodiprion lecontei TaxID=441921 RepID=A0A6J0BJH5_NEOLC|nr:uncharacterized protein LOC107220561 [Neodiprion lecontei]